MVRPGFIALAIACATLPFSALATQETQASQPEYQVPAPFDGVWEGTLLFDKDAFLTEAATPSAGEPVRIEISGPVVKLFMKIGGAMVEMKPGLFHIAEVNTNAVIFATESAPGAWVETMVFAMTQRDHDTIMFEYSRLVNNVGTPLDNPESKYETRGSGQFKRVTH